MKKLFYVCMCFLLFTGIIACTSKEEKANALVVDFMQKHLHDPSSYTMIEQSKVDSLYSSFDTTDEAIYMFDRMKQITDSAAQYANQVSTVYKAQKLISDGQRLLRTYKKKQSTFVREYLGFTTTVKFRAKNDKGAFVRSHVVFRISPDFKKISIEDGDMTILDLFGSDVVKNNIVKD